MIIGSYFILFSVIISLFKLNININFNNLTHIFI